MEQVLGAGVVALAAIALVDTVTRRRGRRLLRGPSTTTSARRALMAGLSLLAAVALLPALVPALRQGAFAFCSVCPVIPAAAPSASVAAVQVPASAQPGFLGTTLLGSWHYAATVLPVFVLACLLSGVFIVRGARSPVRGVWRSFGLAALLPVCACGSVPLGKAMIDRGETGARDGLVFLAAAPLLSPIVIVLAFTVLGPAYAVLRIIGSAIVALVVAAVVRPFLDNGARFSDSAAPISSELRPTPGNGRTVPPRSGSNGPSCGEQPENEGAVLAGWGLLTRLFRYALFGVVLGAIFTAALPPEYVAAILRPGPLSTAAAVVVGVPINMCAGEEILLSAPLMGMGFTMGHALAFALASTGICVGSIPLLAAALGRRAVLALVAVYIVVPFALGLLVDALELSGAVGSPPF